MVPVSALLANTPDVALALVRASACTSGVALDLTLRVRKPGRGRGGRDLFDLLDAGGDGLLFGVELADGRTAVNVGSRWRGADDAAPLLVPGGVRRARPPRPAERRR